MINIQKQIINKLNSNINLFKKQKKLQPLQLQQKQACNFFQKSLLQKSFQLQKGQFLNTTVLHKTSQKHKFNYNFCSSSQLTQEQKDQIGKIKKQYQISELQQTLFERLAVVNEEFLQITKILTSSSEEYSNQDKEVYRTRLNEIQYTNDIYARMKEQLDLFKELQQNLIDSVEDTELLQLVEEELLENKEEIERIEADAIESLIQKDKYDTCEEITLEVRPGVGGGESSIFSEDAFQMYQNYCAAQGWSYKIEQFAKDTKQSKGIKIGVLKIMGEDCYKKLKAESGVHKVIRVPETEKAGRLHSSTISVVVLPVIPLDFKLDDKDFRFEYMRAQGAGGQHVNKVSSACRATYVPTNLSVLIQEFRQQHQNKAKAIDIIKEKLFEDEIKRHQQMVSSDRQEQMGSGDRSDKIRTYNFPQSRITDHRTNLTLYNIEKMLAGDLIDEFIDTYTDQIQNAKIQTFLKQLEKEQKMKKKVEKNTKK